MLTDSENVSLLLDTNNVMVIFAALHFLFFTPLNSWFRN